MLLSAFVPLSSSQLVDTTVEIANKVGAAEITSRVVEDLKDENEQYRKMVMDCIEKVGVASVGVAPVGVASAAVVFKMSSCYAPTPMKATVVN